MVTIPLFPDWCAVQNDETMCTFLGISLPCLPSVTKNTPFNLGIEEGHIWTFLALLGIGLCTLTCVPRPWNLLDSPMKVATGLFAAETAFFALFRYYWGLGRPLIVGAALHNLFEWTIITLLAHGTTYKNVEQSVTKAIFWIIGVVAVTLMVPRLQAAFLLEQLTGIMLDFSMPLMFLYKCYFSGDPDVAKFYRYPALAHSLHILLTILPLVFANFHVGQVSWYNSFYLETAIYISAPMTHILYCMWAWDYDNLVQLTAEKGGFAHALETSSPSTQAKRGACEGKNGSNMISSKSIGEKNVKQHSLIPEKYRIVNVAGYLRVGFVSGLVVLVAVPTLILKPCQPAPQCRPNGIVTGTSVATVHPGMGPAFEDLIATYKLVELARSAPGNLHYELVADIFDQNEFRFIEKWASRAALESWLAGPPRQVFSSPAMKGLLVNGALNSIKGYRDYPSRSCSQLEHGAVSFNVTSSCSKVWRQLSDWSNCAWMANCKYASVLNTTAGDSKRIVAFDDGNRFTMVLRHIDHVGRTMTFEYEEPAFVADYATTLSIQDRPVGGCSLSVAFSVPRNSATILVSSIYQSYYEVEIPRMQASFSR